MTRTRLRGLAALGVLAAALGAVHAEPPGTAPAAGAPQATAPAAAAPAAAAPAKAPSEQAAPAADASAGKGDAKPAAAARGTPQRFEPTEKVRPDFDVSFPVDI